MKEKNKGGRPPMEGEKQEKAISLKMTLKNWKIIKGGAWRAKMSVASFITQSAVSKAKDIAAESVK